ncbi:MAG: hypothetical protein ACRDNO_01335 [Trebonia sp.]
MYQAKAAAPVGAAVLGGAIAVAGCATAATGTGTSTAATTKAVTAATAVTAASSVHGTANIMLYSVNSDGPDFRAVVTGAIGDYGPAVTVYPDGQVDQSHSSEIELKLTRGSFRLDIAALDKKFVQITKDEPIYPATCSDVFGLATDLPVVAGSGTGAYRGITGGFAVTLTRDEVQAKPCGTEAFAWQVLLIAGSGRVADLRCVRVEEGDRLAAPPSAIGRRAAGAAAAGVQRVAVQRPSSRRD